MNNYIKALKGSYLVYEWGRRRIGASTLSESLGGLRVRVGEIYRGGASPLTEDYRGNGSNLGMVSILCQFK